MSRVGKKPVSVPGGVTVKLAAREISVSGPKGTNAWEWPDTAEVVYDAGAKTIAVTRINDSKPARANHGLTRAIIANLVHGVSEGFQKRLQIYGTGYSCKLQGKVLHLNIGFMGRRRGLGSQFELPIPDGIEVVIEKEATRGDTEPAALVVKGFDKQQVGPDRQGINR